jgi:hypothetical protein
MKQRTLTPAIGQLPLGLSAIAPAVLLKNGGKPLETGVEAKSGAKPPRSVEGKSSRVRRVDRRNSRSTRGSDSGRSNDYNDRYEVEEWDEGYITDGEGQSGKYDKNRQIEQHDRHKRDRYEIEDSHASKERNSRRSSRYDCEEDTESERPRRQVEEKPPAKKAERRQRQRRQSEDNPHRHPKYQKSIEDVPERRTKDVFRQEHEGAAGRPGMYRIEEKLTRQRKDSNLKSRYASEETIQFLPEVASDFDDGYETEYEKPKPRRPSRSEASNDSYDRGYRRRASHTSSRSRQ